MYKYKKNLLGLGAGLSFASLAFFAPSVVFADDETTDETLSSDYSTYSVTVDSDTGAITLTETEQSYSTTLTTDETSVGTYDPESNTYTGLYYGVDTTSSGQNSTTALVSSTYTGSSVNADFVENTMTNTKAGGVSRGGALLVLTNSVVDVTGNFINNTVARTATANNAGGGGAIYVSAGITGTVKGNFYGNTAYQSSNGSGSFGGGAIYVNDGASVYSVVGDFADNAVYTTDASTGGNSRGGAVYIGGGSSIGSIEGNFYNNYVYANNNVNGGAVFLASGASTTFTASEGKDYYYLGNYASLAGTISDAYGGFMYMNSATVEFATAESASITIGYTTNSDNYQANYDSIAGTGSITKTGAGTLTVNSSMEYYTGSLTVSAGSMVVNNTLSASSITVAAGASLAIDTLNVYLSSTSASSLNLITLADGATFSMDVLAIYLSSDFELNTEITIFEDSTITSAVVAYYTDADGNYIQLSEEGFTFEDGTFTYDATIAAVPEPSTYAMIFGVIALGFAYYRRRKQ